MAVSVENIGKRTKKEKRRMLWRDIKRSKACYGMIAPFMIFFIIFTIVPVLMSLPIGFTDFDMVRPPKYVGLSNFTTLFLSDKKSLASICQTIASRN